MGTAKIVYNDETLIDLTADTVSEELLLLGATAHNAAGDLITGEYVPSAKQASGSVSVTITEESAASFTCGTVDFAPVACGWSVDYKGSSSREVVKGASYNFGGTSYGGLGFQYGNRNSVITGETTLSGSTISGSIGRTAYNSFTVTVNWWAVGV